MLATCEVAHQLGVVFSMEKPDLPSFGGSTPRPTPTPVGGSPAGQYNSCDDAQATGKTHVQSSNGNDSGSLNCVVPSARDGVICGRRPRQRQLVKMGGAAEFCGSSENTMLQNVTRHSEPWGLRRSTVSLQPCSANLSHMLFWLKLALYGRGEAMDPW